MKSSKGSQPAIETLPVRPFRRLCCFLIDNRSRSFSAKKKAAYPKRSHYNMVIKAEFPPLKLCGLIMRIEIAEPLYFEVSGLDYTVHLSAQLDMRFVLFVLTSGSLCFSRFERAFIIDG